eukprot:ANDGO_02581.mRNA.1 putative AIM2 family protein C977.15
MTCPQCLQGQALDVSEEYEGLGSIVRPENLDFDMYLTGRLDASTKRAIVVMYDIFGLPRKRLHQICDQLSTALNAAVLAPDAFKGEAWSVENFPPADFAVLLQWLGRVGSYTGNVEFTISSTVDFVKSKAPKAEVGIAGFCWGGQQAIHAGATGRFVAVAAVHAARFTPEDLLKVPSPVFVLMANNDPAVDPFEEAFKTSEHHSKSVFKSYSDMPHGFSMRGPYDDLRKARAAEAITELAAFFSRAFE